MITTANSFNAGHDRRDRGANRGANRRHNNTLKYLTIQAVRRIAAEGGKACLVALVKEWTKVRS
jgi:hypothetical protein